MSRARSAAGVRGADAGRLRAGADAQPADDLPQRRRRAARGELSVPQALHLPAAGVPGHGVRLGHPDGVRRDPAARCRRWRGCCTSPTSSGRRPTTPGTRWSTATTTCAPGAKSTAILFGDMDLVAQGVLYALTFAALALVGPARAAGRAVTGCGLGVAALLVGVRIPSSRAIATATPAFARSCTTTGSARRSSPASRFACGDARLTRSSRHGTRAQTQASTRSHAGAPQRVRRRMQGRAGGHDVIDQHHVRRQRARRRARRRRRARCDAAASALELRLRRGRTRAPQQPSDATAAPARAPAVAPVPAPGRSRARAGGARCSGTGDQRVAGAAAPAQASAISCASRRPAARSPWNLKRGSSRSSGQRIAGRRRAPRPAAAAAQAAPQATAGHAAAAARTAGRRSGSRAGPRRRPGSSRDRRRRLRRRPGSAWATAGGACQQSGRTRPSTRRGGFRLTASGMLSRLPGLPPAAVGNALACRQSAPRPCSQRPSLRHDWSPRRSAGAVRPAVHRTAASRRHACIASTSIRPKSRSARCCRSRPAAAPRIAAIARRPRVTTPASTRRS